MLRMKCLLWKALPERDDRRNSERLSILSALVNKNFNRVHASRTGRPGPQWPAGEAGLARRAYAERRFRPLARRRLMMFRPALVDIRFRKPWVLERLILLG